MNSNFADNLKKVRKDNNLSQEQLAEQLGVSRQSVSKWESAQAYPEMDKVLQICKMFNLNIDELLNQNLQEIKEKKEEKNNINKYIDDFLGFVTKTIDMFSSMNFKEKVRCLFEQLFVFLILLILFLIIGSVFEAIASNLIAILPNVVYGILKDIYIVLYLIFAFIIFIHIFKTRYLDYYEIVKSDDLENINNKVENSDSEHYEEKNDINKVLIEKRKEKIVIRDPKHSEYKFINGLLKVLLFIIKCLTMFIFIVFSCSLVGLVFVFIIFIYHVSVNTLFVGLSIGSLSCIFINILILISLFSFIFNKKFPAKKIFISLLISLLIGGLGAALTFIRCLSLDFLEYPLSNNKEIIETYDFNNDMNIYNFIHDDTIVFETDNSLDNKVKVIVKYDKEVFNISLNKEDENIVINGKDKLDDFVSVYKKVKSNLKNNKIYNYTYLYPEVTIITSEANIKQIINNMSENKITNLKIKGGNYYLTILEDISSNNLCYLKDGYYNACVNVDNYALNQNEFTYDADGLHYDHEKYKCDEDDDKYHYCYAIDEEDYE